VLFGSVLDYLSILIFLIFSLCFVLVLFLLGMVASPFRPNDAKTAPYECGFPAVETTRKPFDIRFYLIAILFIVFDVETALLFPWAMSFRQLTLWGVASMWLFLALLTIGYLYEWFSGALNWE
tara:strand:+ start:612 stop:980 length:369 start_codon:yes stop_codon:yes gene_type:complete